MHFSLKEDYTGSIPVAPTSSNGSVPELDMGSPFKRDYVGANPTAPTIFRRSKLEKDESYVPRKEHHVWCNFQNRPIEECPQCKGFWTLYPYETEEEMRGLASKHFPDAIERK